VGLLSPQRNDRIDVSRALGRKPRGDERDSCEERGTAAKTRGWRNTIHQPRDRPSDDAAARLLGDPRSTLKRAGYQLNSLQRETAELDSLREDGGPRVATCCNDSWAPPQVWYSSSAPIRFEKVLECS
jgi:hypothetical protein